MSLILDALKKLERDRDRRDSGVVVVGAVPWQGVHPRRRWPLLLAALLLLAVAAAAAWWLSRSWAVPPQGAAAPAVQAMPTGSPVPPLAEAATTATAPAAAAAPPGHAGAGAPPAQRRLELPGQAAAVAPASALPPAQAAPREELRLVAISERDGRPVAMINDHLLFEGDSFEGVRVLRITGSEVEVEVRGERRVLRF